VSDRSFEILRSLTLPARRCGIYLMIVQMGFNNPTVQKSGHGQIPFPPNYSA